ncbi:hypothetical protein L5515_018808 [Caenorhabditis briggsae]|uniref:Uncharacterized protein n=1 Tax=Caenorhabditis briggsae TaxID=6238 RepID=A0AAE9FD61_CAEBR|nr:hypothetical protein L5515_018808 [Caenorhabditis briggsae]
MIRLLDKFGNLSDLGSDSNSEKATSTTRRYTWDAVDRGRLKKMDSKENQPPQSDDQTSGQIWKPSNLGSDQIPKKTRPQLESPRRMPLTTED